MSKLLDAIQAKGTGRRVYVMPPLAELLDVNQRVTEIPLSTALEYRVDVHLGMRSIARNPAELARMRREIGRHIAEVVFGEFRLPLYEAIADARAGNRDGAIKKIEAVLASMFPE